MGNWPWKETMALHSLKVLNCRNAMNYSLWSKIMVQNHSSNSIELHFAFISPRIYANSQMSLICLIELNIMKLNIRRIHWGIMRKCKTDEQVRLISTGFKDFDFVSRVHLPKRAHITLPTACYEKPDINALCFHCADTFSADFTIHTLSRLVHTKPFSDHSPM